MKERYRNSNIIDIRQHHRRTRGKNHSFSKQLKTNIYRKTWNGNSVIKEGACL